MNAPEWVVNDIGELGVMVNGRAYFLYKGDNIEYDALNEDGTPMLYRMVGKREFGEVCHPIDWDEKKFGLQEKYTRELVFSVFPGERATPEDGAWKPLPPKPAADTPPPPRPRGDDLAGRVAEDGFVSEVNLRDRIYELEQANAVLEDRLTRNREAVKGAKRQLSRWWYETNRISYKEAADMLEHVLNDWARETGAAADDDGKGGVGA